MTITYQDPHDTDHLPLVTIYARDLRVGDVISDSIGKPFTVTAVTVTPGPAQPDLGPNVVMPDKGKTVVKAQTGFRHGTTSRTFRYRNDRRLLAHRAG